MVLLSRGGSTESRVTSGLDDSAQEKLGAQKQHEMARTASSVSGLPAADQFTLNASGEGGGPLQVQ